MIEAAAAAAAVRVNQPAALLLYWLLLRLGLSLISQINAFDRGKVVYQSFN